VSATSVPIFAEVPFDRDTTDIVTKAYGHACRMLHDKGQPAVVQEVIAQRIVEIVRTGERDPNRICQRVLTDLGLQSDH
jgi:hypothetical protein